MTRPTLRAALALAAVSQLAFAQTVPPPGRLLASNCFQCHGTDGRGGFEQIAGKSTNEIYDKLREIQRESEGGIMSKHALGYTDAQMRALSAYLSQQRGSTSTARRDD
jgi:cytochrome subunit of sulfide dehydrogenase